MHDHTYLDALQHIKDNGVQKGDRTGTGTKSIFGMQMRFDLAEGFPLLTTKKLHFKSIIWELLFFLGGHTNNKWLNERGVTIWDEWAPEDGELGPIYGAQWRRWWNPSIEWVYETEHDDWGNEWQVERPDVGATNIDQLQNVVDTLRMNPNDRRMIVSAWNPAQIDKMALPPCHLLFQFWVHDNKLSCQLYQRSCDFFLGVPFNIASYAALVHIMCRLAAMEPGEFIWTGGDSHIYNNHFEQVDKQLARCPKDSPTLTIAPNAPYGLDGPWDLDHFILEGYDPHPGIKAPVAV